MSGITFVNHGHFEKTFSYFERLKGTVRMSFLDMYGRKGVEALKSATPVDTGKTASMWDYRIVRTKNSVKIEWFNRNVVDGVNIAVILQYGHATRNGGYVQGRDYINPAIVGTFDDIANEAWKEVERL